jgi:uncharacterized surface protein with fasciclin (FAS1) repeats
MRKAVIGVLGAVASLLVAPVMAQEMVETATIADIVVASATGETPEFSTLLAAVQLADPAVLEALSNPEAELTVFAPTDAAFAALAEALGEEAFNAVLADTEFLTSVLLYHVVGEVLMSTDVVAALDTVAEVQEAWGLASATVSIETLLGQSIDFAYTEDGISVDGANIVLEMVDIQAANGVIHVIDAVLLPETRTIAELAGAAAEMADSGFGTILSLIGAASPVVVETAADAEAEVTIFVPTDEAFAALIEALGEETVNAIAGDPGMLTTVLGYHVVPGRVSSTALAALLEENGGTVEVTTAMGATFTVTLDMERGILINDTARIILTDLDAANGVIHVIDAVLVPPME